MSDTPATTTDQGIAKPSSVKGFMALPSTQKRVEELIGKDRKSQFMTSVSSMIGSDAKLAKCEPISLFMACLTAAALDLPIDKNLAMAHIIPYDNNKLGITEAQFQLGWRAYVQLAQRSGQYKTINAGEVREGEIKKRDRLSGEIEFEWIDDDNERNKLEVAGYFAFFKLNTGFEKMIYMSLAEVQAHAERYSKAYAYDLRAKKKSSPWSTDFGAMARKTLLKKLIKDFGPMSVDMQQAVKLDSGIIKEDSTVEYIDGETTELDNVNATADKKAAIVAKNKPTAAPKTKKHSEVVDESEMTDEQLAAQMDANLNDDLPA